MPRLGFFSRCLAAAWLTACGSSTEGDPPSGRVLPPNGISIVPGAQSKGTAAFDPNPLSISLTSATGANPAWYNDDRTNSSYGGSTAVSHDIVADDGTFSSGEFPPGSTVTISLVAEGTYPYHCSIHPSMKGTVIVTP